MKIYVISINAIERWIDNHNKPAAKADVNNLTDKEFIEICNKYADGWHFNSVEEYIKAFNEDLNNVPESSHHYIRAIEDKKPRAPKKEKTYRLNVVFGEHAAGEAGYYGYKKTAKLIEEGKFDGSAGEYEFETEKDRDVAAELLDSADGWLGVYWEKK